MTSLPVRAVAAVSRVTIDPTQMAEEVDLYSIPSLDATGGPEVVASSAIHSGKLMLAGGEVLISKLNPRKPRIHIVPTTLARMSVSSTEFIALRAKPHVDSRYLAYALGSERVRQDLNSEVRSATRSHQRVEPNVVMSTRLLVPELGQQRRIADYLDDWVSRIDRVIEARVEQQRLITAAFDAEWEDATLALKGARVPLRRVLTSITDGPFGSSLTSGHYADSGARVVRLGNIGIARFRNEDSAFVSDEYAAELVQHAVAPGDLLMAGLGDETWPLGRCAVAPGSLGPAIVKADCYRIRLTNAVDHEYAAWCLSSPGARQMFRLLGRGATRARLNTSLAREALLTLVLRPEQAAYVRDLSEARDLADSRRIALETSVRSLTEYKQSLITAAVGGELNVTTASSGGVPA